MPDIGLFVVASVLLALAPGPDIIYVLTRGISQGRKAGIAAALGFASGCIFHTVLAAVGVAVLALAAPGEGAESAYLVWIGIQALRHRSAFSIEAASEARALAAIYRQSVIGNMLNPKVTLFFLAFLPQFVNAEQGGVGLQMAILGAVFMMVTIAVFGAVALFAAMIGDWVRRKPAIGERLNVFAGLTFIALGIRVALPDIATK